METKQIVQTSANVIRITNIAAGNTYKRFEKDYDDKTFFGVVRNVYNDGQNTVIEATEYRYTWRSIEVNHKVMQGAKDYILFPATLEEIQAEFGRVIKDKQEEIKTKTKEIEDAVKVIAFTEELISGEMQKKLSIPSFKEMPQSEFDEQLKAIN